MVTNITPKFMKGQYAGTSARQKPKEVQNGSVYYEIDTGKYYMFDEESKKWYVQKDNGGGSSSGGASEFASTPVYYVQEYNTETTVKEEAQK